VIPTNNAYAYDLNGNLLTDGTRHFGYDDENQLISVWQVSAWSNNFVYDGKMRRRIERDFTWAAGTSSWLLTNEIHFIYDGNLVVQERDINNQPQVTYTRGNDLSGKLQWAGGIGGLLARNDRAQAIPGLMGSGGVSEFGTPSYYHADGNGNITMLIASSQMIVAKYLYDSFGNTLAKCGLLADVNNYRFSSKEWNANSGLYYYLYRFYDPSLQRWLNRDPLDEIGFEVHRKQKRLHSGLGFIKVSAAVNGLNLFLYVKENPLGFVDPAGLDVMPNVDMQTCMANCDAAYKCAPGFLKALSDHGLGSIFSGVGTGASCAIAASMEGANLIADVACVGFLGLDAVEGIAIIQEAQQLASKPNRIWLVVLVNAPQNTMTGRTHGRIGVIIFLRRRSNLAAALVGAAFLELGWAEQ